MKQGRKKLERNCGVSNVCAVPIDKKNRLPHNPEKQRKGWVNQNASMDL